MDAKRRSRLLSVVVTFLLIAVTSGCGSSDDSDSPDTSTGAADPAGGSAGDPDTTEESEGEAPSEAFCDVAGAFYRDTGFSSSSSQDYMDRANEVIGRYEALAAEADEADAAALTELAQDEDLASIAVTGEVDDDSRGVLFASDEVKDIVLPCATTTVTITPTAAGIGDVPSELAGGYTAFRIDAPDDTRVAMLSKDADVPPLTAVTGGAANDLLFFSRPGSSLVLEDLEPGSYVLVAGPADESNTTPPGEDQVAELTVN